MSRAFLHSALAALLLLLGSGGLAHADPAISMRDPAPATLGADLLNYNQWLANRIYLGEDSPFQAPDTVTLWMDVPVSTPLLSVFIFEDLGNRPERNSIVAVLTPDSAALALPSGTTGAQLVFTAADNTAVFTPGKHYWLAVGVTGQNYNAAPGQELGLLDWAYASSTVSTSDGWRVDHWISVSNTNGAEWSSSPGLPYIFSMTTITVPEPSRTVLLLCGMLSLVLRRQRALALTAVPLLATACHEQPAPPANILAKVGTEVITTEDLQTAAKRRGGANRQALLDELIDESALVQRAKAKGLDQTPEFQRRVRNLLIATLREQESATPITAPTQADLQALYEELQPSLVLPAARHLAILQLSGEDAAQTLRQAIQRFQALPPDPARRGFGPIAAEFSEDQNTRYAGGDIGWLTDAEIRRRLPAEAAQAALALTTPGSCSEVTSHGNTAFVILLSAQRSAATQPFDKVENQLRTEFENRAAKAAGAAQKGSLRKGLDIQIDESRLRSLLLPDASSSD